jgi:hypothetical protein
VARIVIFRYWGWKKVARPWWSVPGVNRLLNKRINTNRDLKIPHAPFVKCLEAHKKILGLLLIRKLHGFVHTFIGLRSLLR